MAERKSVVKSRVERGRGTFCDASPLTGSQDSLEGDPDKCIEFELIWEVGEEEELWFGQALSTESACVLYHAGQDGQAAP